MLGTPDASIAVLDVREMLAAGEEPLDLILETAARVSVGGVLQVTAPFEPVPLYAVLSLRGFIRATATDQGGAWCVRLVQTGIIPEAAVGEILDRYPATIPVFSSHGMDLCCGGTKSVELVARAHGVDLSELLAALQLAARPDGPDPNGPITDPHQV